MKKNKITVSSFIKHLILVTWSMLVLFPLWTMLVNSIKKKIEIFRNPFIFPKNVTFEGYVKVFTDSNFFTYFRNSLFVTVVSVIVILFFGSLAAYAIANWKSKLSKVFYFFFIAGLMIPIRLGSINIFQIIKSLGLIDSIFSLFPVYIAMGMPIAVFILTTFIQEIPKELLDAAIIDGAHRGQIYWAIILPLVRPALATVAIFNLIPIWNGLWFPLIFISSDNHKTLTLGVTKLFGQYQTQWTEALAVLSLASLPLLILYMMMSKQFIKGLTAGALKG
ncbi:MAG: carbohydrate ABC transporter permease [Spirochaetes bacterium]|nr:carbohydrate ABC transporter permease [Spirochaetota bacterium]